MKKAKQCESVVLQYDNGDRETIDDTFLLHIMDENSSRIICCKVSYENFFHTLTNILEVAGQRGFLSSEGIDNVAKAILDDLKKQVKDEE